MNQLGVLEESVLLILLKYQELNGASVVQAYRELWEKSMSLPTAHVVLKRLEKKGLVQSAMGDPDNKPGGKRKRLYQATAHGYRTVHGMNTVRTSIWQTIPHLKYE